MALARKTFLLILRVKENPRAGPRNGHRFRFQLKILEIVIAYGTKIVGVCPSTVANDRSLFSANRLRVLGDPPAVERLAIKEALPPCFVSASSHCKNRDQNQETGDQLRAVTDWIHLSFPVESNLPRKSLIVRA